MLLRRMMRPNRSPPNQKRANALAARRLNVADRLATCSCRSTTDVPIAVWASSHRALSYSASTVHAGCAKSATVWVSSIHSTPNCLFPIQRNRSPRVRLNSSVRGRTSDVGNAASIRALRKKSKVVTNCRMARCSRRPGKISIPRCKSYCCGAPATSTLRSHGRAESRPSNTAGVSKVSFPSCFRSIATAKARCRFGSSSNT